MVNPATSLATKEAVILKLAKTLRGNFTRQMGGEKRKWREVPPDEKALWLRMARNARKLIIEPSDISGGVAATRLSVVAIEPRVDPGAGLVSARESAH